MKITTQLSNKALILRNNWEQEKPAFYEKIKLDEKAMEIINALAEMCASRMSMKELQKI
ncbi:MAG: hypothetical protein U9N59_00165 [Campylobacterota bacterium]|nr:hypothetical protein [Campylobacterota bacterium]